MKLKNLNKSLLGLSVLALVLVGCNDDYTAPTVPNVKKFTTPYSPVAKAGLPTTASADANALKGLYASAKRTAARSNPFMLTKDEISFDEAQNGERLFAQDGSFALNYTPKETEEDKIQPEEPQPYRRLMGIVIGDAVVAILETQGEQPVIIRPGMQIPNSEWRVVSIDEEQAVLARDKDKRPNTITVRLENPPPGFLTGGGPAAGGGAPAGGPPAGGGQGGGKVRPGGASTGGK